MGCGLIASLLPGLAASQEAIPEPVPPSERLVGIAYANWFRTTPWHDVWGTPDLGEYTSFDRAVIRQHAEWLHDAGVDFVWLDSWNEWKRGEQPSPEVSKDIEPSKEFGRFYLDLMKEEIARFKGRE